MNPPDQPPPVAAIIPVLNRPRAILDALHSVAAQQLPPARLIVVDDGSTDQTPDVVQSWIDDTAPAFECRLIRQPNRGVAAARNRAAAEAGDCEFLAWLDSDDLWPADYLQRMIAAL